MPIKKEKLDAINGYREYQARKKKEQEEQPKAGSSSSSKTTSTGTQKTKATGTTKAQTDKKAVVKKEKLDAIAGYREWQAKRTSSTSRNATDNGRMAQLSVQLQTAREQERSARTKANAMLRSGSWKADNQTEREAAQKDYEAKSAARKALEAEVENLQYQRKYADKVYDDTFTGQFGANYTAGRMQQDSSIAWNNYLNDPTEENRVRAQAIDALMQQFQSNNEASLDDKGAVLPWVSKSAANYLPQLVDQTKYSTVGGLGGAVAGAAIPVVGPVMGAKAGIVAGSGVYSYNTMRGAAFKGLLELGADEETARAAANDEAVISSLIEMADTGVDIATLGVGKLLTMLGKGGAKAVAGKAAESAAKKLIKGLAGYGLNIAGEMLEEGTQEAVSIANERRMGTGESGILGLAKDATGTFVNAVSGKNGEDRARVWEAAKEGGKIAAMMGGATRVATGITNTAIENSVGKQFNNMGQESVQAVIDTGLESDKNSESYKMASALKEKQDKGKTITNREIGRLYQENVKTVEAEQAQTRTTERKTIEQQVKKETGYGDYGTKAFVELMDTENMPREQLRPRFQTAYEAGLTDMPTAKANLTTYIQRVAFNAGKQDYIMSSKRDANTSKYATVYGKESGFIQTDAAKGVDQATIDTLNAVSKALGMKSRFVESVFGGQANGSMSSDGILSIAKDAVNPYFVVTKHEVTHRMQQLAPTQYTAYRNYAVQLLAAERGDTATTLVESYQNMAADNDVTLTTEQAMDEIAADFTERILTDEDALRQFAEDMSQTRENRTVAQKFFEAVREFIRKVKSVFHGGKAKMDSAAVQEFGATVEQLEKAEKLWQEAFRASQTAANEMTRQDGQTASSAQQGAKAAASAKYSLNPDFGKQFDAWLKNKTSNAGAGSFFVGTTSDALQSIGVSDYKIYWRKAKLAKIMKEHRAMTADVIKSVPNVLENPILVMQSQTVANRITLFGEAMDADGKPVLVAVELSPQNKSGEVQDFAVIVSAYGKNGAQQIIDNSDILYVDPNKKRTDSWLGLLRLQLPSSLTRYGSIDTVTLVKRDVKGNLSFGETGKSAMQAAFEKAQEEAKRHPVDTDSEDFYDSTEKYSLKVTDKDTLNFLNSQETITTYKTMQLVDGKLYPPMASRIDGKFEDYSELGKWEQATEHPELIRNGNKFKLDKGKGQGSLEAAYNPYMHSSNLVINDQFTGAYTRNNLVTVECEVPVSEMTSGYHAQYAKDSVGWHSWHTGTVAGQIRKAKGTERQVFLSRWIKPVRIVPDSEVASMYKELLDGTNVEVPDNVVTPSLLDELKKAGVKIKESGRVKYSLKDSGYMDAVKKGEKFSLKDSVEETKNLLALHNLSEDKLLKTLSLGGFPMPSIAVTKANIPHTNFGDITLVMNKSTIDPKANRKNTVYSADAWTPTFPKIEYEVNRDAENRIYEMARKANGSIPTEYVNKATRMAGSIEDYLNNYQTEEGVVDRFKDEYAIKALYLADKGEQVETKTQENRIEKEKSEMLDAVLDLFDEDIETLSNTPLNQLHAKYADEIKNVLIEHGRTEETASKMVAKQGGIYGFSKFMSRLLNYARKPAVTTETVTDYKAIEADIDSRIDEDAYEKWLAGLFDGLIKDSGIYNNKEFFTPSGNRRTFKQTHYPVTLENIAKAMAGQNNGNTKNVSGFYGIKSLRAGTAERFKSIADMHKREGRLQHLTEEQASAISDALQERMFSIMGRIAEKSPRGVRNDFIQMDSIGNILMEIADSGTYTVDSIMKSFNGEYKYTIGNGLAADIRDLLFDVSEMPVNIFEAKPERVVRFDEVLAAVLPDNAGSEIRAALKKAGVMVMEYKAGDDVDRLRAVNSVEGAKFSLKEQNKLMRENAQLKETVESLREQFKTTKFAQVDKKSLDNFTKQLLKDYKSGAEMNDTREALNGLYTYIANGENGEAPVWDEAYKRAYDVAVSILENSSVIDDEMYREYADLRKYLRTTGMTLDRQYNHDLYGYENYQEFRKAYLGKIKLVKDGIPVDVAYQELAVRYPEFFDETRDLNQADMLTTIAETLDRMEPTEINPYSYNMRESATWLANDILERFYELPQAKPTFADKAEQKLTKQVIKDAKKLERVREQKNERIREIIEKNREKVKTVRAEERVKRAEALKEVKTHYKEKERRASNIRKARDLRDKITRHAKDLSDKLLKPTDKQHIPQELQGAVAKLLESINQESNYTFDEATQSYRKNDEGLPTKRTQAFAELKKLYSQMANELVIDPDLLGDDGLLSDVIALADKRLVDMNSEELQTIWNTLRAVEASIQTANKVFSTSKWESISEAAEGLRSDNKGKKEKTEYGGPIGKAQKLTGLDMMTPESFLHRLGSSGDQIFRMLRDAQDAHIRIMKSVSDFTHDALGEVNVRKLERELHDVTLGGEKVKLSTAQIMELYVLSRREQALEHIYVGGILPDVVSASWVKKITKAKPVRGVTMADVGEVISLLTDDQKAIAEKLQEYVSTELSRYGNEASMKVYNYEKFGEKMYWPIRVNRQETQSDVQKDTATTGIPNRGFTKGTKPHANNSVKLGSIFDTFATHASEMATYAAYLGTMEDVNRIRNYRFLGVDGRTTDTVKAIIDTVHGTRGNDYLQKLLVDITNGVKGTHGETAYMSGIIGNFKAAAVGANLRVIIQQPTAILRAMDMIDPQYLAVGMKPNDGWEKALKYAPIAQWKDWGYFDINTGRQMKDVLFDSDSALDKVKSVSMWGAGKADSISWGLLWNAVEAETKEKRQDLNPGTDDFYQAVSKRFTEIIDHTQVVDGILQRSQIMRSADSLTKMATSFMAEPTKQYNMAVAAAYDAKNATGEQKNVAKRRLARTAVSLVVSGVVNAMAQSIMDAVRDDDKEKEYWEKWLESFFGFTGDEESGKDYWDSFWAGNLGNMVNPAAYIPYAKDVLSIIQGYDVSRMDMESVEKFITASQNMGKALSGEGKYTIGGAAANLFAEAARLIGVPVANLKREVKAFAMLAAVETDNYLMQYRMEKASLALNYAGNSGTFMDILYNAYKNDPDAYNIIYKDMIASGYDPDKLANGMETRMKKDQGVKEVKDLDQRYLHPDQQPDWDKTMSSISSSFLWKNATEEQRDAVEEKLYGLVTDSNSSKELQEKLDKGASYGLDETEYLLYTLALDMYDQPNKSGEYGGTPTNEEKADAITAVGGLNNGEIAFLWDTDQGYDLYNNGIDMQAYVEYVGSGGSVNTEKLIGAKDFGMSEEEYFNFLETLKEFDQPTASGKYGTYTQDEATAAIKSITGLSREQRSYLWQSVNKGWKSKNNPWR